MLSGADDKAVPPSGQAAVKREKRRGPVPQNPRPAEGMPLRKNSLAALCCLLVGISNCSGPNPPSPLTKAHISETLRHGAQSTLTLPPGTHTGCVTVPGGFIQRALVGFQFTGEECSFTISAALVHGFAV